MKPPAVRVHIRRVRVPSQTPATVDAQTLARALTERLSRRSAQRPDDTTTAVQSHVLEAVSRGVAEAAGIGGPTRQTRVLGSRQQEKLQ